MKYCNLFQHKTNSIDNIAFIFGCPRSGTTFLWSLLESHDNVIPFLLDYKKNEGKYKSSESGVYIRKPKLAKHKLKKIAQKHPRKLIIEKTPAHTFKSAKIKLDFPNAKFIVIFRNPIAIVNSMLKSEMKAFKGYTIEKSVSEVKKYFNHLMKIYNEKNTYYLTYECLYMNTSSKLGRIFDFLCLSTEKINPIIEKCKGKEIVSVDGALRRADPFSFNLELSDSISRIIKDELKEELSFYNSISK